MGYENDFCGSWVSTVWCKYCLKFLRALVCIKNNQHQLILVLLSNLWFITSLRIILHINKYNLRKIPVKKGLMQNLVGLDGFQEISV